MADTSTCYKCIPTRNSVIVLGVLTTLGGFADIFVGSLMATTINCVDGYQSYYGYYEDVYYNGGYDNGGYVDDNYYYSNRCHMSFLAAIIIIISLGSVSSTSGVCLLIGVKQVMPSLLICFIIFTALNGVAYFTMSFLVIFEVFPFFTLVHGYWFMIWSALLFFFVSVVNSYRVKMIQQLTNRGLGNAANSAAAVIPTFQAGIPGGMHPTTMTVHPGQPGNGVITQLQPGTYAQPGNFVYPVNYLHAGTYAQPQPGAYLHPGAYPQAGAYPQPEAYSANSSQPGTHRQPGTQLQVG